MDDIKITDRLRHEKSMNPDRNEYRAEVLDRAADYIERLEAVVRAGHALIAAYNDDPPVGGLGHASDQYFAARSRVNLSTTSNSSVTDGHESADKCGPDCSLEVLRPGQVQCNRDGAKCPNKEASDGKA